VEQDDKEESNQMDFLARSIPTLYPNPATEILNLKFEEDWIGQEVQAEIIGVDGKVYLNKQMTPSDASTEENDISELPKGIYLLRLSNSDGYTTLRFIKQ
jgi:hypothetical protein